VTEAKETQHGRPLPRSRSCFAADGRAGIDALVISEPEVFTYATGVSPGVPALFRAPALPSP
jgi:hypothetical protein